MKNIIVTFSLVANTLVLNSLFSQSIANQANWQQQVNHEINVTIEPISKLYDIKQNVIYTNNSNVVLNEIYFHVWPAAFENKQTPFAKESRRIGTTSFVHALENKLSKVNNMLFTVNGQILTTTNHEKYGKEVLKVSLITGLKPGETVTILNTCNFKLPALFSRYGISKEFISLTQWYPKPAVFDVNGWHVFPYKSIGEYYSEYGNYIVNVTVPKNNIVAATGDLQTPFEIDWLNSLANGGANEQSNELKTITWKANKVHDFALFTATSLAVAKANFTTNSGAKTAWFFVDTAFTQANSQVGLQAIQDAIRFYEQKVGEYPYKNCSAVIANLSGAGGMEYPTITICLNDDPSTIIHEVGHNWFQGMIGSNERDYPWMDESINTFYQNKLDIKKFDYKYKKSIVNNTSLLLPTLLTKYGLFQPTNLHSDEFSNANYGASVYSNGPLQIAYLEEFLGENMFDSCMRNYYKAFAFKHPLPADLQMVFEKTTNQNLNWFFKDVLNGAIPNFKINKFKAKDTLITITNKLKGNIPATAGVFSISNDSIIKIVPNNPVKALPFSTYSLNPNGFLMESKNTDNAVEFNRINNNFKIGFASIYKRGLKGFAILPNIFTFNMHDGYTPGIIVSNFKLALQKWEWYVAPSFGFRSSKLVGLAHLQRNWYNVLGSKIPFINAYVTTNRFSFIPSQSYTDFKKDLNVYNKINPGVTFSFKRKKHWDTEVNLNYTIIRYQNATYFYLDTNNSKVYNAIGPDAKRDILNINISRKYNSKNDPMELNLSSSISLNNFTRVIGTFTYNYTLPNAKAKAYDIRVQPYLIYNKIHNTQISYANVNIASLGFNSDANMSELSVFRNRDRGYDVNKLSNMQVLSTLPAMRFPMQIPLSGNILAGLNTQIPVLPFLPIQLYFDVNYGKVVNYKVFWTGGLVMGKYQFKDVNFEVSLPLVYSKNLKEIMDLNYNIKDPISGVISKKWRWYEMVQFKVNIALFKPKELIKKALSQ